MRRNGQRIAGSVRHSAAGITTAQRQYLICDLNACVYRVAVVKHRLCSNNMQRRRWCLRVIYLFCCASSGNLSLVRVMAGSVWRFCCAASVPLPLPRGERRKTAECCGWAYCGCAGQRHAGCSGGCSMLPRGCVGHAAARNSWCWRSTLAAWRAGMAADLLLPFITTQPLKPG